MIDDSLNDNNNNSTTATSSENGAETSPSSEYPPELLTPSKGLREHSKNGYFHHHHNDEESAIGDGSGGGTTTEEEADQTLSVENIYGDKTTEEIELSRQQTHDEMMSRISRVASNAYSDVVVTSSGFDNVQEDGSEFKDYDPELVTWDGDDDPKHPRNWKLSKKWLTTSVVGLYTMVSPLSSSILSPAVPKISKDLGITDSTVQSLSVSVFLLAWVVCILFMGPISELYGRKLILNISIFFLLIFNIACAVSKTTAQLIVFRFLAGVAGSPPVSVGAGTLADMFADKDRNTPLAVYSLGPLIGPVMAPIIAGFAAQYLAWPWVFWILAIMNGVIAIYGYALYEETYAPVLLKRKANRLKKETGNENLHTVFELQEESFWTKIRVAVTRPIKMLFTHPVIFGLGLFMAFMYGFMYLLLVTFPDLWTEKYHYSVGISGLMYLGLGVGFCLGLVVFTPLIQYSYLKLIERNGGVAKPEFRLILISPVTVLMAIGLFWYGWSAQATIHWVMPCIGTGFFGFGLVPMFQCIQLYLIDMNPRYSASAVGAAAVFRSSFGFSFPLFGREMYDKMGYGWANSMCGILCLVLGVPFPLIIFFYGERLRNWVDSRIAKY